jgi:integrase
VLKASGQVGRHGKRDRTLILLAYRHGLRVSELVAMRWEQIDLKAGLVHVARVKNGTPSTHPIRGPELRALRELRRQYPESPYLFVTERGGPTMPATVRKLVARAGELAKLPLPYSSAHAPALRRLQVCERWARHSSDPAVPRTQEHHTHGALHRVEPGEI